jgi:patatin-related protein
VGCSALAVAPPSQPPEPKPLARDVEEVRLALALNGGVSLAVWMGGCAVELDAARRAHLGVEDLATEPGVEEAPPPSPAPLSRRLLARARRAAEPEAPHEHPRRVYAALCEAFRRELSIDLLSGASAGGINGALLGAAITAGTRLHPDYLRGRWLQLGDFSQLLHPTSTAGPTSLMQGDYFREELRKAFRAICDEPGADAGDTAWTRLPEGMRPAKGRVSLDVTVTNVLGEERTFRDEWGGELVAREHRGRVSFRRPEHFASETLAAAARASASFPAAFEPTLLEGDAVQELAGFGGPRWAIDGGLLDNAPVRAVLEQIPSRGAARQVRRYVCYVNADPPLPTGDAPAAAGLPPLAAVGGYVVNLPRSAPFVDQLSAIRDARRRALFANDTEIALLGHDLDGLLATAGVLLDAYRTRRRLLSLEETLGDAEAAEELAARLPLEGGADLPWIPVSLELPAGEWHWGIRAAQRVIHLGLDLVRRSLRGDTSTVADRGALVQARAELYAQLEALEGDRDTLRADEGVSGTLRSMVGDDDLSAELAGLQALWADYAAAARTAVREAARALFRVSAQLGSVAAGDRQTALGESLFGPGWLTSEADEPGEAEIETFLRRALAIEVVRRAFFAAEDIDNAQRPAFVQLTPFAPTPVLSARPLSEAPPDGPAAKLTGLSLGHFAAFYRGSWRANDFMWGRLDAAARLVELLVDAERARGLAKMDPDGERTWTALARALAADATPEAAWLVEEALAEAGGSDLEEALRRDLEEGDGSFTRTVCTRAVQLEILRHELPHVERRAAEDRGLGSRTPALTFRSADGLRAAIEDLRGEPPLPRRLGRGDPDELGSTLALRTIAHAGLVAVAMLRHAGLPAAGIARAPLLPIAGVSSRSWWNRLGVVVGFAAAATFLAARLLQADPRLPAEISGLRSWSFLLTLLALAAVLGVVLVPFVRALRGSRPRRLRQLFWLGLLVLAFAPFVALANVRVIEGPLTLGQLLAAPGAPAVPGWLVGVVATVVLGLPLLQGIGLPGAVRARLERRLGRPWGGWLSLALLVAAAVGLLRYSLPPVFSALGDGWHESVAAGSALLASLACAAYVLLRRD